MWRRLRRTSWTWSWHLRRLLAHRWKLRGRREQIHSRRASGHKVCFAQVRRDKCSLLGARAIDPQIGKAVATPSASLSTLFGSMLVVHRDGKVQTSACAAPTSALFRTKASVGRSPHLLEK